MYKTVNQGDNIKIQKIKINGKKGQNGQLNKLIINQDLIQCGVQKFKN